MRREKLAGEQSFITFRTAHVGDRADFALENFGGLRDRRFADLFAAQEIGSHLQI